MQARNEGSALTPPIGLAWIVELHRIYRSPPVGRLQDHGGVHAQFSAYSEDFCQ